MRIQERLAGAGAALHRALAEISPLALEVDSTAYIRGRVKSAASSLHKMRQKQLHALDVGDLLGVRVIVSNEARCYELAARLCSRFRALESGCDDYVYSPKANGYRSLHLSLLWSEAYPLEVQIRTWAMHVVAERGGAAHSLYKLESETVPNNVRSIAPRMKHQNGQQSAAR